MGLTKSGEPFKSSVLWLAAKKEGRDLKHKNQGGERQISYDITYMWNLKKMI